MSGGLRFVMVLEPSMPQELIVGRITRVKISTQTQLISVLAIARLPTGSSHRRQTIQQAANATEGSIHTSRRSGHALPHSTRTGRIHAKMGVPCAVRKRVALCTPVGGCLGRHADAMPQFWRP